MSSTRTIERLAAAATVAVAAVLLAGCGAETEDLSYTRPEWRESVAQAVTLPLAEPVTLTVGLATGMAPPAPGDAALAWLTEQTNVTLRFVGIPTSPGDIEFGRMIRSGELPDIVAEARVDLTEASVHRLFVDFLEWPSLLPNYAALLASNPAVRAGALARLTAENRLLSLGTYDRAATPFVGVLAYRQDLFRRHELAAATWPELRASMERLKELYPDSYPFGVRFSTMLRLMPSWFGSGYDPMHVVYFNTDAGEWRFGPAEAGFRDFVTFLTDGYAAGLIGPDAITARDDTTLRSFASNTVFLTPHTGPTGPYFRAMSQTYGGLTTDGEWDGLGQWVAALPLPPAPGGGPRWAGAARFSSAGPGWLVSTQGDHVGEAIALLDFLYSEEAAARAAGLPLVGLLPGRRAADSETLEYRYFLRHDAVTNTPGRDVMVDPGVRVPLDDDGFSSARLDVIVTLQSHIESQVAGFMVGRRPLSEYDDFVAEALRMGAERLVDLHNERARVPLEELLAPLIRAAE